MDLPRIAATDSLFFNCFNASNVALITLCGFVVPIDLIPDFIAGFGYSDDAAALAAAIGIAGRYLRPEHRAAARRVLLRPDF